MVCLTELCSVLPPRRRRFVGFTFSLLKRRETKLVVSVLQSPGLPIYIFGRSDRDLLVPDRDLLVPDRDSSSRSRL
jgi:hypothetical protein